MCFQLQKLTIFHITATDLYLYNIFVKGFIHWGVKKKAEKDKKDEEKRAQDQKEQEQEEEEDEEVEEWEDQETWEDDDWWNEWWAQLATWPTTSLKFFKLCCGHG